MAIRILTKNGIENTNIDGARDNNFNAGQRSGVVKGILNEGNIYANGSSLVLEPCELRICGHRIVIDENEIRTFTNKPQSATKQSLIAQIVVSETDNVEFELIVQGIGNDLIQDNLDKTGMGKYQLLLATFTQNTDGSILNLERVADLISGITKEQIDSKLSLTGGTISGPLYIGKFEIYRMNGGDGFYIGVGDGGSDILSYQKGSMLVFNDATTKLILRGKEERPQYIDGNSKLNTLALTSDTTDKIKVINNIYKTTGIIFSGQSWQTNSQLNTAFTTGGGDLLIIISGRMTCDTFVSKLNFTIDSSASSSIDDSKSVYFDYNSPLDLAIFTVNNISAGTHTFRLWAQKYGGDGTTILPAYNTTQITIIEL